MCIHHNLWQPSFCKIYPFIKLTYESNKNDFETTIFIGNLPFVTNEEELRKHFAGVAKSLALDGDGDGILNVRVIRDPKTFIGKGIGYI